jgi:hypothetical protein
MQLFRHLAKLALLATIASPAMAGIIFGTTVDGIGSTTAVGSTEYRSVLANQDIAGGTTGVREAVKYYIPLVESYAVDLPAGESTCTYGIEYSGYSCGTASDYGDGGLKMSMYIMFNPVSITEVTWLEILFEDLDLRGANDPYKFFEKLEIFNASGDSLTGVIRNIDNPLVQGSHETQQLLSLELGTLESSPLWLELQFKAKYRHNSGWNTPEYLIAAVTPSPLDTPPEISVPAPSPLFILMLGMAFVATRKALSPST